MELMSRKNRVITLPEIVYTDKQEWEPLERVVGERCKEFMYMGMVPIGEVWIFLYKHIGTRRYLNLDGRKGAYRLKDGTYYPVDLNNALEYVYK